jgi:PAS domain S-box-containing protein
MAPGQDYAAGEGPVRGSGHRGYNRPGRHFRISDDMRMNRNSLAQAETIDDDQALRYLVEGTAAVTGQEFFTELVRNLAGVLRVSGAWVTEYRPNERVLHAFSFVINGEWRQDYEYALDGTPCQPVIEGGGLVHFPERLVQLFPDDHALARIGAVSYMAMPLLDVDGRVMGHVGVLDDKPMPYSERSERLLRIFAARATAELQRMRAETAVRENVQKLSRLVKGAMDAIIELDRDLTVTLFNPAAEKVFRCPAEKILGSGFQVFLSDSSRQKLSMLVGELQAQKEGRRYLWIPGGLTLCTRDGEEFPAEATLSCSAGANSVFFTLILRDLNERIEAEKRIQSLANQAAYLREELQEVQNFGEIVGRGEALLHALRDVQQVAPTDTTVLILGETGTGKELFARAIHNASTRKDKPLIKVNCAAIPAQLMESEFFGHERGAFTGATSRREGRFALADGGTIFLDEIGELSLDLQAKLLRVLQEGEFEPVGSSRTRKVDVRVVAATNRDLLELSREGKFREDLYYRLNVFPVKIPPLRDRREDIPQLAQTFVGHFAKRMGRPAPQLTPEGIAKLQAYGWPGNVRELQNVIERAVITSRDGRLDLDRALPEMASAAATIPPGDESAARVLTAQELLALERENIVRALESCQWRVAGERGAAQLLGINPSTLASRMKALNIARNR